MDKELENRISGVELAKRYRQGNLREGWGSGYSNIMDAISRYKQHLWEVEVERAQQERAAGREVENFWAVDQRLDDLFHQETGISIRADIVEDMVAKGFFVERDLEAEDKWIRRHWADPRYDEMRLKFFGPNPESGNAKGKGGNSRG